MWENMEAARKAALQAQTLSTFCQQMCAKSEEDTARIQKDIKRRLEIKVKDVAFWIGEAETRLSEVKELIEELQCLGQRAKRGRDNCRHNLMVDGESMAQIREETEMPEVECAMRALLTEAQLLTNAIDVVDGIIENTDRAIGTMQNVATDLELELKQKHEDLRVDQQSIVGLKRHSAAPEILRQSEVEVAESRVCKRSSMTDQRRIEASTDGAGSNATIKGAAAQVAAVRTLVEGAVNALDKLTLDLESEGEKVARTLGDVIADAQQQKADLEHHLAMVDEQMSEMVTSESLLQRALDEKQKGAGIVRGQLLARGVRGHRPDDLTPLLRRELAEAERDLGALCEQAPQLQGASRSLRRSRLRLEDAIARKTSAIGVLQVGCANARGAIKCVKL